MKISCLPAQLQANGVCGDKMRVKHLFLYCSQDIERVFILHLFLILLKKCGSYVLDTFHLRIICWEL